MNEIVIDNNYIQGIIAKHTIFKAIFEVNKFFINFYLSSYFDN